MYRSLGDALQAAGRKQQALAAYQDVLKVPAASAADRKAAEAEAGIKALET